jgi:hypothetical protein
MTSRILRVASQNNEPRDAQAPRPENHAALFYAFVYGRKAFGRWENCRGSEHIRQAQHTRFEALIGAVG